MNPGDNYPDREGEEPLISEFLMTALEKLLPTVGGEPKI